MSQTDHNCEVCRMERAVGVASSPLGPVSLAYGRECLNRRAEPYWLIAALVDEHGSEGIREDIRATVCSYVDGRYLSWDQTVEHINRIKETA